MRLLLVQGKVRKVPGVLGSQGGKAWRNSQLAHMCYCLLLWGTYPEVVKMRMGFWETLSGMFLSLLLLGFLICASFTCSLTTYPLHQAPQKGKETVAFWLE